LPNIELPKANSALPISVAGSQNKNASAPTHRERGLYVILIFAHCSA